MEKIEKHNNDAEIVAQMVDRLITVEIRNADRDDRSIIPPLYDSACQKFDGKPVSLVAAQRMIDKIKPGDNVFLVDGFAYKPNMPNGENDGPLGIASLARAINLGLGALPIIVVGEADMEPVCQTVRAAGLTILDYAQAKITKVASASAITFPVSGKGESERFAASLIDEYAPKAALSVETVGPNQKGIKHSGSGYNVEAKDRLPGIEYIFYKANARGILTIGCIDGGNEIGSGTIEEAVRRITPRGDQCRCPCQTGIACAVKTDIVFPASVSNWGAYGINAMLACLLQKPEILQDAFTERRMLEACINAGGVDGETGQTGLSCDGVDHLTGDGLITMLNKIIETALKR